MENFTNTKNKYVRRAKISEYKFRKMVKYFAEDLSATQISILTAINRNTVNRYLNEIRGRIVEFCEEYAPFVEEFSEEQALMAVTNSPVEPRATAGDGSSVLPQQQTLGAKLTTNLGLLKRRGKVYAEMLANCTSSKLHSMLQGRAATPVTVHSVEVKPDFGLIVVGYDNVPAYANKPSYVDNLDNFWTFTKERMDKFQGIAKHKFYMHLKESEFRFNFRNDNLYAVMLKLISSHPIS